MKLVTQTIYKRGSFSIVPQIDFVQVTKNGRVLDTYRLEDIEEAIDTCDEMAETEEYQQVA